MLRLLEAPRGKTGKREYVQVLRLLEHYEQNVLHTTIKDALQMGAISFAGLDVFQPHIASLGPFHQFSTDILWAIIDTYSRGLTPVQRGRFAGRKRLTGLKDQHERERPELEKSIPMAAAKTGIRRRACLTTPSM